jgi:hypothetical protein
VTCFVLIVFVKFGSFNWRCFFVRVRQNCYSPKTMACHQTDALDVAQKRAPHVSDPGDANVF